MNATALYPRTALLMKCIAETAASFGTIGVTAAPAGLNVDDTAEDVLLSVATLADCVPTLAGSKLAALVHIVTNAGASGKQAAVTELAADALAALIGLYTEVINISEKLHVLSYAADEYEDLNRKR